MALLYLQRFNAIVLEKGSPERFEMIRKTRKVAFASSKPRERSPFCNLDERRFRLSTDRVSRVECQRFKAAVVSGRPIETAREALHPFDGEQKMLPGHLGLVHQGETIPGVEFGRWEKEGKGKAKRVDQVQTMEMSGFGGEDGSKGQVPDRGIHRDNGG